MPSLLASGRAIHLLHHPLNWLEHSLLAILAFPSANMKYQLTVGLAALTLGATATPSPSITASPNRRLKARASSLPESSGTSALSAAQTIAAGDSFDGGMVMYDRGVTCTGQDEGGDSDAVFQIEES